MTDWRFITTIGHVFLLAAGLAFAPPANPESDGIDVHPRRLLVWEKLGADKEVMDVTLSRIDRLGDDGHGSWIHEWENLGDYYLGRGQRLEVDNRPDEAESAYLHASAYYAIGKFPDNSTEDQRRVYNKHLEAYQRAGAFFDVPLRVVQVPWDSQEITVYLHLPDGVDHPPLVLWANGMDTHKGEIRNLILPLVNKGIAVATFDAPGTGESMEWTGQVSVALQNRLFEFFAESELVDGTQISTVGVSFAGNYAARWAAENDRLSSAVVLCGVTHTPFTWSAEQFASIPPDVANTMAQAMGVPHWDWKQLSAKSREYDLFGDGRLEDAARISVPVLLINGDQDLLVPIEDLGRYADLADSADVWVLGGDGHCAPSYLDAFLPKMADWIAGHFD